MWKSSPEKKYANLKFKLSDGMDITLYKHIHIPLKTVWNGG